MCLIAGGGKCRGDGKRGYYTRLSVLGGKYCRADEMFVILCVYRRCWNATPPRGVDNTRDVPRGYGRHDFFFFCIFRYVWTFHVGHFICIDMSGGDYRFTRRWRRWWQCRGGGTVAIRGPRDTKTAGWWRKDGRTQCLGVGALVTCRAESHVSVTQS